MLNKKTILQSIRQALIYTGWVAGIVILVFCQACRDGGGGSNGKTVGVLLSEDVDASEDLRQAMEWALENINQGAGQGNGPILVKYVDLKTTGLDAAAESLAKDGSICAVIAAIGSKEMMQIADVFVKHKKILITPTATSVDIFRAYSDEPFIWRTVESDVAQMKAMMDYAVNQGFSNVALLAGDDAYGDTFYDCFGFFAAELNLTATKILRFDQINNTCDSYVEDILAAKPDVLFAVPANAKTAECIARQVIEQKSGTRFFFSDSGIRQAVIRNLGDDAEGIEGFAPVATPENGFDQAFSDTFKSSPPPFAANAYDAMMIVGLGMIKSNGKSGKSLADAMAAVVDGRDASVSWNRRGISQAILAIQGGGSPDITGASGSLEYDEDYYMEPVTSTYARLRVDDGTFVIDDYFSTQEVDSDLAKISMIRHSPSSDQKNDVSSGGGTDYYPPVRTGLRALIVAGSSGWENYRHQADALAQYQMLRQNGVKDDDIVLIMADDIANNSQNKEKGVVRNMPDGPNLYRDVKVDYTLEGLRAEEVVSILSGQENSASGPVIDSGPGDNIYIFFVSHGSDAGIGIGATSILTPEMVGDVLNRMRAQNQYRRVWIAVESCHAGVFGDLGNSDIPGVVVITGANADETSKAINYDRKLKVWLADGFAYALWDIETRNPDLSMSDFYELAYERVSLSHVSVYHYDEFGNMFAIGIDEFITP